MTGGGAGSPLARAGEGMGDAVLFADRGGPEQGEAGGGALALHRNV